MPVLGIPVPNNINTGVPVGVGVQVRCTVQHRRSGVRGEVRVIGEEEEYTN